MLCLSQAAGYAVKALICLEREDCHTGYIHDIARCAQVPPAYLAKVFKKLGAAGIIEARRGRGGGTRLAKPAAEISILQIARAVDGPHWIADCLLGEAFCRNGEDCFLSGFWTDEKQRIEVHLNNTKLADVARIGRQMHRKTAVSKDKYNP